VKINLERDNASARNLASLNQSGIHFVGLNHLESMIAGLEQLCTAEASQPAVRQKGATSATGAF
jgi:hypothetical protein